MKFDHIAVTARNLSEGVAYVKECLGVDIPAGGTHPTMGTHNHLLSLGPDFYLEVIAIDPAAKKPETARWYGLDQFDEPPRIGTWVLATQDLDADLARTPVECGSAMQVTRGALRWRISVPSDGSMPMDGAFPTLIEWGVEPHPASSMASLGVSLRDFTVFHPQAAVIDAFACKSLTNHPIIFKQGESVSFEARFETPSGLRVLR